MSLVFERLLNEMLAELAAGGFNVSRAQLRSRLAAALWSVPPVLDDDGRIVDFVSGQEVDWRRSQIESARQTSIVEVPILSLTSRRAITGLERQRRDIG